MKKISCQFQAGRQLIFSFLVNLTKKQERDMEREVKQLVADISEFEDNLKKRSLDLVIDRLSSEQRKILFELINEKALTAIAQGQSINQIRHHHTVSFQTPPIPEIVFPTDRNRRLIQDIGRFEIPVPSPFLEKIMFWLS